MEEISGKKRKNFISIISIVFCSLILLIIIFGVIDYFRTKNGGKPIFIYRTVNTINDVGISKETSEYYGFGYKVLICDNNTNKYIFQIGYEESNSCFTELTCKSVEEENFVDTHKFSFFDGKLYRLETSLLRPIEDGNEENFVENGLKLNDINGIKTEIAKIDDNTYMMNEICEFGKIADDDLNNCMINYYNINDLLDESKEDIIDFFANAMKCK